MIWWGGSKDNIPPGWAMCNGVDNSRENGGGGWVATGEFIKATVVSGFVETDYWPFVAFAWYHESTDPHRRYTGPDPFIKRGQTSEDEGHVHRFKDSLISLGAGTGGGGIFADGRTGGPVISITGNIDDAGPYVPVTLSQTGFQTPRELEGGDEDGRTAKGGSQHRHWGDTISASAGHVHNDHNPTALDLLSLDGKELGHGHGLNLYGVPGVDADDPDDRPVTGDTDAAHDHDGSKLKSTTEPTHTGEQIAASVNRHTGHDHGMAGDPVASIDYVANRNTPGVDDAPALSNQIRDSNHDIGSVNSDDAREAAYDWGQLGFVWDGNDDGSSPSPMYSGVGGNPPTTGQHEAGDVEHEAHDHDLSLTFRSHENPVVDDDRVYSDDWSHVHYVDHHSHLGGYLTKDMSKHEHASHEGHTHGMNVQAVPQHDHKTLDPKEHLHTVLGADAFNSHVHAISHVETGVHTHLPRTCGVGVIPIEPLASEDTSTDKTFLRFIPNPCRPKELLSGITSIMGSEERRNFQEMFRGGDELPVGSIILWPRSRLEIPLGWEVCDGRQKSAVFDKRGANSPRDWTVKSGVDLEGDEDDEENMVRLVDDYAGRVSEYPHDRMEAYASAVIGNFEYLFPGYQPPGAYYAEVHERHIFSKSPWRDYLVAGAAGYILFEGIHEHDATIEPAFAGGALSTDEEKAFDEFTGYDSHTHQYCVFSGGAHSHGGGMHGHGTSVGSGDPKTKKAGSHIHDHSENAVSAATVDPHKQSDCAAAIEDHDSHHHHVLPAGTADPPLEGDKQWRPSHSHALNEGDLNSGGLQEGFTDDEGGDDVKTEHEANAPDADVTHQQHTHENMVGFKANDADWNEESEEEDEAGGSHYHTGDSHSHEVTVMGPGAHVHSDAGGEHGHPPGGTRNSSGQFTPGPDIAETGEHKHRHASEDSEHSHIIVTAHSHVGDHRFGEGGHMHGCGKLDRIWCIAIEKVSSAFDVT